MRPPTELARTFHARGWWRTRSVVHDLYRASAAHPNRTAIMAHRVRDHAGTPTVRVSYAQLTGYVERFAHALVALGVGPGDPVAFALPNRWEGSALFFACLRIGAVAVPILPSYGARDLEAVLDAAQPRCAWCRRCGPGCRRRRCWRTWPRRCRGCAAGWSSVTRRPPGRSTSPTTSCAPHTSATTAVPGYGCRGAWPIGCA
ncbi:AMP-binding protein [Micromonospora sp. M12]